MHLPGIEQHASSLPVLGVHVAVAGKEAAQVGVRVWSGDLVLGSVCGSYIGKPTGTRAVLDGSPNLGCQPDTPHVVWLLPRLCYRYRYVAVCVCVCWSCHQSVVLMWSVD